MNRGAIAALSLAVLLVLSGCAALDGDSDGPADEFESVTYPAGTGPAGFANATQILQTHQDQVASDSYRLSFNLTRERPGQTDASTTFVASNATQERQLLEAELPRRTVAQFATPDAVSAQIKIGDETSYQRAEVGRTMADLHHRGARPGPLLETIVETGNYTPNRTDTIQGHDVIWFESDEARANATGQIPDQIDDYEASVAIDESGRIWRADLVIAGQNNGTQIVSRQSYRTHATGGVSVTRPAWVSNATES